MDVKYLDLASSPITIDENNFQLKCYFPKNFTHSAHGNNSCLNSLADIIISLGQKLEILEKKIDIINRNLTIKNKPIEDLSNNNDYIKNQNNDIISLLNKLKILNTDNILAIIHNETKQIKDQYNSIEL